MYAAAAIAGIISHRYIETWKKKRARFGWIDFVDDPARLAVATKCTFCVERIDDGLAQGLRPGVDPEATPACVNSCITQTLQFGDLDDPNSAIAHALESRQAHPLLPAAGTRPRIFYLD